MENCTVYSHKLDFNTVAQIVQTKWPKAVIELNEDGLNKSFSAVVKGGLFSSSKSLNIKYRERLNPSYQLDAIECGLTKNLSGMANFVQSLPAENKALQEKLIYKVLTINSEMTLNCEPEISPEFQDIIKSVTAALDGFIFAQPNRFFTKLVGPSFLDKDFQLIMDVSGDSEVSDITVNIDSKYFDEEKEDYTTEQLERKSRSEEILHEAGVKVNENLPCIVSSEDTLFRDPEEIIERAYALLIVAVKGEGLEKEHVDREIKKKNITSFSPREQEILDAESLSDADRAYATWRYESLNVMLWALGKVETLDYPNDICDVATIVKIIHGVSREEFEKYINLRSEGEILDQLDLLYRMHWACVDARVKGESVSGDLDPGIVYERRYSLHWLCRQDDDEWDEIVLHT